jgi:parvulin-like peptidyl-prolyl isomerase
MSKRTPKEKNISRKFVARRERERRQSALIRNIALGIVLVVVLLIGYGYLDQTVLQQQRKVAVVNGEEITLGQFQARVKLERDSLIDQYLQYFQISQSFGMDMSTQLEAIEAQLAQPQLIGQNVLETMIYELLYRQEANAQGISFSAEPTEEPVPTPQPIPTMTATAYTLEGYQQTYSDVLAVYAEYGLSEADYRFLFESRLYYQALYDIVTVDVAAEGEYVWARHILLDDPLVADVVREKVLAGEDFGALAQEVSTDPSAATNSGDLGWFTTGVMIVPFEEAAFALEEVGDISEVIQTDFGYHIIQLLGREMRPLDSTAVQNAQDEAFMEWISAIRESGDIETFDIWQSNLPTKPDLQETLEEIFAQQ